MRDTWLKLTVAVCVVLVVGSSVWQRTGQAGKREPKKETKLAVLWTSGDPHVAERMGFMYLHNAEKVGWFDRTELIVWGPSAKLLSENEGLQKQVKQMMEDGVRVRACIVCARTYGVVDDLREMGITVIPMGKPLTEMLQSDWKVLSL